MEGTLRATLGLLPQTRCVALGGTAPDRYFNDLAHQAIRAAQRALLAALIPRPAVNLLLYHGVLAPRAR